MTTTTEERMNTNNWGKMKLNKRAHTPNERKIEWESTAQKNQITKNELATGKRKSTKLKYAEAAKQRLGWAKVKIFKTTFLERFDLKWHAFIIFIALWVSKLRKEFML